MAGARARLYARLACGAVALCHCSRGDAPSPSQAPHDVALAAASTRPPEPATSATLDPGSRGLPNPIAYIPPQCFTKMDDGSGGRPRNPCYVCHLHSEPPNYADDGNLQVVWAFPGAARDNPWTNLFVPPVLHARHQSDEEILSYVRQSNYFDAAGGIALADRLRDVRDGWDLNHDGHWDGFVPDVWFRFDDRGFDHRPDGSPSGWRAFAYYPFPGTFFPTNGSADDVLVRLDPVLQQDETGRIDPRIYALNLAVVEALVRRADVRIDETDETAVGVDLDLDGKLGRARRIAFDGGDGRGSTRMRYVGRARDDKDFPIAPGLFPLRTEFFHSVRYLDVVPGETAGAEPRVVMAPRMKELRYAKKVRWLGYAALKGHAAAEAIEQRDAHDGTVQVYSEFERGIANGQGWIYQGFIEDADGALRPQTFEESVYCVGCHGGIGAPTDGIFSFPRRLAGTAPVPRDGWFHWSQHDLRGLPEPKRRDGTYEYTRYLAENHAGDELRENAEVVTRFFDEHGALRPGAVTRLHGDIATLLLPSAARALDLDRAYQAIVAEQSFVKGRDAVLAATDHVYAHPPVGEKTGVDVAVGR
jgi:hypothetical protein